MDKKYDHKFNQWVYDSEVEGETVAPGVVRKIMAYCDELMSVANIFEKGAVGAMHSHPHTQITYVASGKFEFTIGGVTKTVSAGDTLLKQDSVVHGCTCLEAGVLMDFFTPMREDFVK
jgi:quercetin dioxygenase-like cupin family protein